MERGRLPESQPHLGLALDHPSPASGCGEELRSAEAPMGCMEEAKTESGGCGRSGERPGSFPEASREPLLESLPYGLPYHSTRLDPSEGTEGEWSPNSGFPEPSAGAPASGISRAPRGTPEKGRGSAHLALPPSSQGRIAPLGSAEGQKPSGCHLRLGPPGAPRGPK